MQSSHWKQSKPWLQSTNSEASSSSFNSTSSSGPSTSTLHSNSSPTKLINTRRSSRGFPDLDFDKKSGGNNYNNNKLILSILDVTSTNVCLSVFTPSPPIPTAYQLKKLNKKISMGTGQLPIIKPPVLSVQLDRRPWPHVAHTGSLPGKDGNGNDTTLVIYGLDSDRKYEITLSLLVDTEEESSTEVEVEVNEEGVEEPEVEVEGEILPAVVVTDSSIQATTLPPSSISTPESELEIVSSNIPPSVAVVPEIPITSSASTPPLQSSTPIISTATPEGPPPPYSAAALNTPPLSSSSSSANLTTATEVIPIPIPAATEEPIEVRSLPITPISTSPPPPDETSLRALLKKIRTSSKRTETVLNASISALRKSVEKGIKEDQRARTRIVGLEEGIRKAKEAEVEAREIDFWECEERIAELNVIEREVKEELERRRLGKTGASASSSMSELIPHHVADLHHLHREHEETEDEGGHHEGLADIAKELDSLNSLIAKVEKDSRQRAKDTLKALEAELGQIEGELTQMDRHEASYRPQMMAGQRSSDSFERYGNYIPPQQEVVQASSSSFRWRRNNNSKSSLNNSINSTATSEQPAPSILSSSTSSAISIVDPRNFGRFFRRSVAANTSKEIFSSNTSNTDKNSTPESIPEFVPNANFHPQTFAQERQSMWSSPPSTSSLPLPSTTNESRYPTSLGLIGNRSRSSSLILSRSRSGSLVTVPEGELDSNVMVNQNQIQLSPMGMIGNALGKGKGKGRVRKSQHKKNNSNGGGGGGGGGGGVGGNTSHNDSIIEGEIKITPPPPPSSNEKGKTLKKAAPKEKVIVEKLGGATSGKEDTSGGIISIPPPPPGGWSRFKAMRPGQVTKTE